MSAPALTTTDPDGAPPQDVHLDARTDAEGKAHNAAVKEAMRTLVRPVRGMMLLGTALSVLSGICAVLPYAAIVQFGHLLLEAHEAGRAPQAADVMSVVVVVIAALLGRSALYAAALLITHVADVRLGVLLRRDIVRVLGRAPLAWFSHTNSGLVTKAVRQDTEDLHYRVAHNDVEFAAGITMPVAAFAYLLWLDWRLALLSVVVIPVYLAAYGVMTRGADAKMLEVSERQADIAARVVEFVSGIQVVKTFGRAGRAHARYRQAGEELAIAYANWGRPMFRLETLSQLFLKPPVTLLITLGVGGAMAVAGHADPVDVLATALIGMMLPSALYTIISAWWGRAQASHSALRLHRVLQVAPLPSPASPEPVTGAAIEVEHVSYAYGDTLAVDDVTLSLPAGSLTALVGPSGSGKSTLATLIARFADPDTGTVRIGGTDLRQVDAAQLYRQVSFVLQNVRLVVGTLAENIRLGRPDATDEQVIAAARAANIHDEIMALPAGYDTVIGVDTHLSGGQAQRVSIARAVLADTPVLILDEATAFADPESERAIHAALADLLVGRTVVVIAHRLETIVGADRIVVLDRGAVAESGTHEELVAAGGTYARLWSGAAASTHPSEEDAR